MDKVKKVAEVAKVAWYKIDKEKWAKRIKWFREKGYKQIKYIFSLIKKIRRGETIGGLALLMATSTYVGPTAIRPELNEAKVTIEQLETQLEEQSKYFEIGDAFTELKAIHIEALDEVEEEDSKVE